MKIRTCYFKTSNMQDTVTFWQALLGLTPVKSSVRYSEFCMDNINLGFVLNDFNDKFQRSNCVPVFEFADAELQIYIDRLTKLGGIIILDGLEDPHLLSVVASDPWGNEFELSKFHG